MNTDSPWLVVGLGNPGAQYAATRHNVGHMVIDTLAARVAGTLSTHRTRSRLLETRLGFTAAGAPGPRVLLAVLNCYMNESGGPVKALLQWAGLPPSQLLVVHDELDIPEGALRLKRGGGEGGHNGLRSITKALGTKDYARLRVGIGRPPGKQDPADFVLRPFPNAKIPELGVLLEEAADAVTDVSTFGLEAAQMRLHTNHL